MLKVNSSCGSPSCESRVAAVSYTHLDVYKRQAWAIAGYGFRVVVSSFFADIHKNNELNNFVLPVVVTEGFLPVSYTHLDVYKRQVLINSECALVLSQE